MLFLKSFPQRKSVKEKQQDIIFMKSDVAELSLCRIQDCSLGCRSEREKRRERKEGKRETAGQAEVSVTIHQLKMVSTYFECPFFSKLICF